MRGAGTSLCIRFFDAHKTGYFLSLSFLFFLGGLDGNCHSSCSTSTQWSVSLWLKALILPFCFVFVDKYSVLRGVAGEGEKEREGESNTKWHLNISPFQVYNDCVNVSLRTKHRATCLTVCADWLPCLSSHSPPHPSVFPISFSLSSTLPSSHLPDLVCHSSPSPSLPVFRSSACASIWLLPWRGSCFNLLTQLAWTQTHIHAYDSLHRSLSVSLLSNPHTYTLAHHTLTPDTGRWPICQASCRSVFSQPQRAPPCPGRSDPEPDPQHCQHHCPYSHPLPAPSMLWHSLRPDCAALFRTHKPLRAHPQNENDNLHHLTSNPKVIYTIEDLNIYIHI